jgi:hypothetical protein
MPNPNGPGPCGIHQWQPSPGHEGLPCVLIAGHAGEHEDVLGTTWDRTPSGDFSAGGPGRWIDTGSGPGVTVPVPPRTDRHAAYEAFLDHYGNGLCVRCAESPTGRCAPAQRLWAAWREASRADGLA